MSDSLYKASLLDLLLEVDPHPHNADPSIHPVTKQRLIPFHLVQADYHLSPPIKPMGRINPDVLLEMIAFEANRHFPVFTFFPRLSAKEVVPQAVRCVAFDPDLVKAGRKALAMAMEALVWFMRGRGSMKKRAFDREDIFSVFADPRSTAFADLQGEMAVWDNVGLTIFRGSTYCFDTCWIGATMIVYEGEGRDMKVWVQKRSAHTSYGGMLDTTVGGAVETERTAWEGMAKEAEEEANLSESIMKEYARFVGTLNFQLDPKTVPKPLVQRPEPSFSDYAATQPQICDDEVDCFIPMSIPEIQESLQQRKFQQSAVPDLIFFLFRHGFITRENEPQIDEIMARCQREHHVAFPHRLTEIDRVWQ